MTHYRLYFMNPRNGHIDRGEDVDALDDAQAIGVARTRIGRQPLELWQAGRKVHRFETKPGDDEDRFRPSEQGRPLFAAAQ